MELSVLCVEIKQVCVGSMSLTLDWSHKSLILENTCGLQTCLKSITVS